jgi:hypothetical protein
VKVRALEVDCFSKAVIASATLFDTRPSFLAGAEPKNVPFEVNIAVVVSAKRLSSNRNRIEGAGTCGIPDGAQDALIARGGLADLDRAVAASANVTCSQAMFN